MARHLEGEDGQVTRQLAMDAAIDEGCPRRANCSSCLKRPAPSSDGSSSTGHAPGPG